MIHCLQCLCGPRRHAVMGILYDDANLSPQEARAGLAAYVEDIVAKGLIYRRCEICDAPIKQFQYEDGITKEQDWDRALAESKRLEAEQTATRQRVQATRRAEKN